MHMEMDSEIHLRRLKAKLQPTFWPKIEEN